MDTPKIWEQLGAIHEQVREKAEQHFNKDQPQRRYAVCKLSCISETSYATQYGKREYLPLFTDARFDVRLVDIIDNTRIDPFDWAISCTIRMQGTGEIYIDDIRYSGRTVL